MILPRERGRRAAPAPGPAGTGSRARRILRLRGRVQGVGFRPFVHRAAVELGLGGAVWNEGGGLVIDVEGTPEAIAALARRVRNAAPLRARIDAVAQELAAALGRERFAIGASVELGGAEHEPLPQLPPDAAPCVQCLSEVANARDRRHAHAFASCTDCGPRYSIARALPFDRARTSMAAFALCARCAAEHDDPGSRRFHAQTNACPECGPRLWSEPAAADALASVVRELWRGGVVAVKGLGGFHLLCDATDERAVRLLRERKRRTEKPFALLFGDLPTAEREVELERAEREALLSARAPIVLARRRPDSRIAAGVAPGLRELGCALPSTPLHRLLAERCGRPLVLTSGNVEGEPLCASDDEARARLAPFAERLLLHDREIVSRVDDSLVRVALGRERVLRRARGYVPEPVALPLDVPALVAFGADSRSTLCVARGGEAVLSQPVGELSELGARRLHAELREHLLEMLGVRPRCVVHDADPANHGTRLAREYARELGLPAIAVQHHHAHVAACLAEHGRTGPVLALAWDGAGLGEDGTIWGGELLVADLARWRRLGCLRPIGQPGGDAAAREPWRTALAHLWAAGLDDERVPAPPAARALLRRMLERGLTCPQSSSMGRLFDAAAALAGLRWRASYAGQAAAELEARSAAGARPYPMPVHQREGLLELDPRPLVRTLVADAERGASACEIGSRFHAALAAGALALCSAGRARTGLATVALSGGCFQNRLLLELVQPALERAGFEVLAHERVPCGDGGLALGQAAVAAGRASDVLGDPR